MKDIKCTDCGLPMRVPFDNGDGKVRCAACAVDKYMKLPVEMVLPPKPILVPAMKGR